MSVCPEPRRYTIEGQSVELPVVVRDASSAAATYLVSARAARRLLPGDAIDVVELLPGRALMSLAAIDYRDNDLGDYNEISIAFFVRERSAPRGLPYLGNLLDLTRQRLGTYIHRLPVTQSFTCEAGCRIWGFPKTVDEIELGGEGRRFVCTWRKGGRHVLTFSTTRGGTRELPERSMLTYSFIHGVAHRTPFVSGAEQVGVRLGGAELRLGDHPIADELRELGLPKAALLCTWMGRMRGRFEAPQPSEAYTGDPCGPPGSRSRQGRRARSAAG